MNDYIDFKVETRLVAIVLLFMIVACSSNQTGQGLNGSSDEPLKGKGVVKFQYQHIKNMNVWYYVPTKTNPNTPILFVMHGVKRNADEYRDGWINAVEAAGIILIVPEYSQVIFPRSRSYNLGNMFDESGQLNAPTLWSFNLIEPIFDMIQARTNNKTQHYHLFGHSAGAQFAHRYMLFASYQRLGLLMSANAGWYTTLDDNEPFPYGLQGSPKKLQQLKSALTQDVVIMLGEKDTDPQAEYLRQTPQAKAQGQHRFARGQNFYTMAKALAERNQWPINWRLVTVPGVGHDNKGMADRAISLLLEYKASQSLTSTR